MSGILSSIKRAAAAGSGLDDEVAGCSGGDMQPGDTWAGAMRMVATLPGGIPVEFRSKLWLTLAEGHLEAKGIDWNSVEKDSFSEWSHEEDCELGVQIVKDLHRTGCSLFCGEDGVENQALLKRVLLGYARWNKAVGYCQGFNMLAALILQVVDKKESDALKVMIYLIEGVLPDSYFADSLRGLSVDMAVFRDLLKKRLPRLSRHLDTLQNAAKDGATSYEPPLTNVFTMQWFLTLFCNCLPHGTVLRVWDLIMLDGNEILLRTALAIWSRLAERILTVKSADGFYCLMGVLTNELLEFDLIEGNILIKTMVQIGCLKDELKVLREHYSKNITPWEPAVVEKQLRLYPKERLALDISALKKQYVKLRQRQRQAHIIFTAAISRQPPQSSNNHQVAMNHLLLDKSALVAAKRLTGHSPAPKTLLWKDTKKDSSSSSSDTELCDEDDNSSSSSSADQDNNAPEDPIEQAQDLEFEQFLQDRCQDDTSKTRRNSSRALEIMQENSLILHRIMQCQKVSDSPPTSPENDSLDKSHVSDWLEGLDLGGNKNAGPIEEDTSPKYGFKYSSILEKSKSLDERYNCLIGDKAQVPRVETLIPELSEVTQEACSLTESPKKSEVSSVIQESQELHDLNKKLLDYLSNKSKPEPVEDNPITCYKFLHSPLRDLLLQTSLNLEGQEEEETSPKSPKKTSPSPSSSTKLIFNPFPVPISSRQNKEVPLKLGLYKK